MLKIKKSWILNPESLPWSISLYKMAILGQFCVLHGTSKFFMRGLTSKMTHIRKCKEITLSQCSHFLISAGCCRSLRSHNTCMLHFTESSHLLTPNVLIKCCILYANKMEKITESLFFMQMSCIVTLDLWRTANCYTVLTWWLYTGLIPGLRPANERRRYFVTTSLIGWAQA